VKETGGVLPGKAVLAIVVPYQNESVVLQLPIPHESSWILTDGSDINDAQEPARLVEARRLAPEKGFLALKSRRLQFFRYPATSSKVFSAAVGYVFRAPEIA
jgi:hypothetical protein